MKRWTTVVGRGGTVLIAISLALLLVSLIPQINLMTLEGRTPPISPERVFATNSQVLNPQQGVQVKVTVEGTLKVYLLEMSVELQFVNGIFVNGIFDYGFNLTDLQEILEEHPDRIIWEREVENGEYKRSYTPTRVMNATLVFHNPSLDEEAIVDYEITLISTVAPGEKVRNIAYWITPIGIILAIPWLVNMWKQRKS